MIPFNQNYTFSFSIKPCSIIDDTFVTSIANSSKGQKTTLLGDVLY